MNPTSGTSVRSNLEVNNHNPHESQEPKNRSCNRVGYLCDVLLAIVGVVGVVVFKLWECLPKVTENTILQRDIQPLVTKAALPSPSTLSTLPPITQEPSWVKDLKDKGAKQVCSWVLDNKRVSVFHIGKQFAYTLTHRFPTKDTKWYEDSSQPSIWYEESQQFNLDTDDTFSIEETIAKLQKKMPVIENGQLTKFVNIADMGYETRAEEYLGHTFYRNVSNRKIFLIYGTPIRWVSLCISNLGSPICHSLGSTIFNPHRENLEMDHLDYGKGIFDSDLAYASDYFEFANDEYHVSDEGKETLKYFLPEFCELHKKNLVEARNALVCFKNTMQAVQSDEDRQTAFEKYIPFQTRLSWMADFQMEKDFSKLILHKIQIQSRLSPDIKLDRDNWAATLADTGQIDSNNPLSRFGHAVLLIEGIRRGRPFMWLTHLTNKGIRLSKDAFSLSFTVKGHTRTWQVHRHDTKTKKGVISIVTQILKEKRTKSVEWGYVSGTHNCTTWAIEKLNDMLEPKDRMIRRLSIVETLLYHKAKTNPYPFLKGSNDDPKKVTVYI